MNNKVERYDWALPGDDGQFRCIPVGDLKIDHSYQRAEIGDKNILAIARNFQWSLFGVVIVMERASGALYVVDGQQRLASVKRRGDIAKVPCFVFKSEGKDHEARAFIGINTARAKVSAADKFTAAAKAAMHPEKEISEFLAANGLRVSKSGKGADAVTFPAGLVETWSKNAETAKEALLIQRAIAPHMQAIWPVHRGIAYLLNCGIPVRDEVGKLMSEGGLTRIKGAINAYSIDKGVNDTTHACAKGVLSVMNYRRKTRKYRLPSDEE